MCGKKLEIMVMKSYDDFVKHMWKLYPEDNMLEQRTAMLKAWDFLTGKYDREEVERLEIAEQIRLKMIQDGLL